MNGGPVDDDSANGDTGDGESGPALRIVRGEPSDEELAALTVVLAAMAGRSAAAPPAEAPSGWNHPGSRLRRPLQHGPGAWRASARPH